MSGSGLNKFGLKFSFVCFLEFPSVLCFNVEMCISFKCFCKKKEFEIMIYSEFRKRKPGRGYKANRSILSDWCRYVNSFRPQSYWVHLQLEIPSLPCDIVKKCLRAFKHTTSSPLKKQPQK